MVQEELQTAHHLGKQNEGRPRILPVRIGYRKAFQYPLSEYLDPINWAYWQSTDDTPRIIEELKRAISGVDLPLNNEEAKAKILKSDSVVSIPQPFAQAQPTRDGSP